MQSAATSIFDPVTFLETTHKGNLDTHFVLPDPGDYLAQITDKIEPRSGIIAADKQRGGEPWLAIDIQWELLDDTLKTKLNMDKVFVRQGIMLDIAPGTGINGSPAQLDLGVNKNMRLKRLWDATGLNKSKTVSIGMLKFATALVHVEHRPDPNDPDIIYAEVTRVTSPDKARSAG